MSWINADTTRKSATIPAELGAGLAPLQQRPVLAQKYMQFVRAIEESPALPERLAALLHCRTRYIHGLPKPTDCVLSAADDAALKAGDRTRFSSLEQTVLEVAEQMPFAHHEISDATVAQLHQALDAEAVVVLLTAAAFYDVNCRLELCWQQQA